MSIRTATSVKASAAHRRGLYSSDRGTSAIPSSSAWFFLGVPRADRIIASAIVLNARRYFGR
jgi:hypothetical protein